MALVHFALATRDVGRAARFFEATMGWRPIDRPGNIGRPAAWLEVAPGQELHLIEVADYAPSDFDREYGRHLAFAVPVATFPDLKRRLEAHGATLIDAIRPTPFERFFFRDPDGYIFEVVGDGR